MTDLDERQQLNAEPRSALAAKSLTGHHVLLITIDEDLGTAEYAYGYRAVSDVITGLDGQRTVQVAQHSGWHPHAETVTWPAELVLVTCAVGCACLS
ncbi:hypothetical protein SAMN05421678_12039 [Actinopolymorpha cephalotaxi]|uniref:Uncharacterized protein n=1 Tax=Actinopolymorpha cephalotaxi TaxID=504797 RepID=A0A1I3AR77_9ACTN|nr:hypothetical protein [Actinopolymorpha cephalotaxi]NYH86025.1 hypothetical protein [Actinopolymorpha cephalotaxi]SFH52565.1 hypothetical protein SAMN05421678_12039 [Actinopolymorpha cephalotaxi]